MVSDTLICADTAQKLINTMIRFPEQELWDNKRPLIDLEHPGVSAWSFDYHVFTIGLNRDGVIHHKFATALDAVYDLLCPKHIDGWGVVPVAAPVVAGLVEAVFHCDQDTASRNTFLVWSNLMSWTLECEASLDVTVHLVRT